MLSETGFVLCRQKGHFSPRTRQIKQVHRNQGQQKRNSKKVQNQPGQRKLWPVAAQELHTAASTPRQNSSCSQLPTGAGSFIVTTTQNRSLNKCRAFCAICSELKQIPSIALLTLHSLSVLQGTDCPLVFQGKHWIYIR